MQITRPSTHHGRQNVVENSSALKDNHKMAYVIRTLNQIRVAQQRLPTHHEWLTQHSNVNQYDKCREKYPLSNWQTKKSNADSKSHITESARKKKKTRTKFRPQNKKQNQKEWTGRLVKNKVKQCPPKIEMSIMESLYKKRGKKIKLVKKSTQMWGTKSARTR